MNKELEKLHNKPSFTTEEAVELGISKRMLSYYVQKGELERIARGVYCSTSYQSESSDFNWEDLAVAANNIGGGVICLTSALAYYELTDEIMRKFWIAVEANNSKAKFPMTKIVRMRNITLGVEEIELAGMTVKIFDIERTIIDSFRFLSFETAMKALKSYMQGEMGKPNLNKMNQYIKALRASKVQEFIRALTA